MNADEYQQLAARTLIDRPEVPFSDDEIMLMWCVMGLTGEAGEVAKVLYSAFGNKPSAVVELKKEIGDVCWYIAGICTKAHIDMSDLLCADILPATSHITLAVEIAEKACAVSEYLKKAICHRHGLDRALLILLLSRLYRRIVAACEMHEIAITDAMQVNIEKLKARYPEGYSSERSINRENHS